MKEYEIELGRLRACVDTIDEQIVVLLNRRVELAIEMGVVKKKMKKSLRDTGRELHVKDNLKRLSEGKTLCPEDLCYLYEAIICVCLRVQQSQEGKSERSQL